MGLRLVFVFLIGSFSAFSQTEYIDSVKNTLKKSVSNYSFTVIFRTFFIEKNCLVISQIGCA